MANEEHVAILKRGVEVWNQWRKENLDIIPNLRQANFFAADLRQANLHRVILSGANLRQATLSRANLSRANLREVDLIQANLSRADLSDADLSGATLNGAALCYADLSQANLSRATLHETDFEGARVGWVTFGNVDLRKAKGLNSIKHFAPSTIGIDTIYASHGQIPEVFLRGSGVSDNFIAFISSFIAGQPIQFYSCFISHSSKDKEFVERLYADLQSNGVRCWYAPHDLEIGEPVVSGIDRGIRLHDKLLLILSENSIESWWVDHEVQSALSEEKSRKARLLFPIRLDDTVLDTTIPWANTIRSRHIGDFCQWKDHDSYRKAFERLLKDLKAGK